MTNAQTHSGSKTVMIDGFNLSLEKGTGVSTYARNLSYELHAIGYEVDVLYGVRGCDGKNDLLKEIGFFDPQPARTQVGRFVATLEKFGNALLPGWSRQLPNSGAVITRAFESKMPYFDRLWNSSDIFASADVHFTLTNRLKTIRSTAPADLAHWTYPLPLKLAGAPNVYTIHDLVPLRLPYTTLDRKRYYLRLMKRIVREADGIITVSENSRKDIISLLGCPEEKVINTYQSVNIPKKLREKSDADVRGEIEGVFDLPYMNYFLFFGSIEPKKNIGRLIEAYLASEIEAPLVIVGAQAWKSEQELRLMNPSSNAYLEQIGNITKSRERIRRFDYATFPLLVSLIRGAKGVLFPSLYEGFGLPILESMQLGTPVVTSSEGSVPEVAGDAACLVDPYDPRAICAAIRALDGNAQLRQSLCQKGRKQVEKFTPEAHQERLRAAYSRFIGKSGRF